MNKTSTGPRAATEFTTNPRRDALAGDAAGLRVQIEALLLDPRGRFRPRPLTLRALGAADVDEILVMQVGEHDDGTLSVITPEPLPDGGGFDVAGDGAGLGIYVLASCRGGHRPEDGALDCWISLLRPRVEAAQGGASSGDCVGPGG